MCNFCFQEDGVDIPSLFHPLSTTKNHGHYALKKHKKTSKGGEKVDKLGTLRTKEYQW